MSLLSGRDAANATIPAAARLPAMARRIVEHDTVEILSDRLGTSHIQPSQPRVRVSARPARSPWMGLGLHVAISPGG
jgi:hypothetical protein